MKKNKSTDLPALLPRARSGDQEAQLAIVIAFRPLVQKLAGQEKNPSLRMDLASQLVLGLLEAIRKYPGEDPRRFPGFVNTHLHYLLSHYIRKQIRWNKVKEKIYAQNQETSYTEDFTMRIRRGELQKALQCLTPAEHRLVCLATVRGTPWKSIGREFGCPVSSLYGRYRKALQKMKKKMENNGTEGK